MSKASDYANRVKAAPPTFGPCFGPRTHGYPCRASVTEAGEAFIHGHVNAEEAKRLIQWLKETFDD